MRQASTLHIDSEKDTLLDTLNTCDREATAICESPARAVRVLAIIEGDKVSGPAKNVLEFCRTARTIESAASIELSVATFQRSKKGAAVTRQNELVEAARQNGVPIFVIPEGFPFDVRVIASLRDLTTRLEPDVIETHAVKSHVVTGLSGVGKKIPWIAFHHGYTQTDVRSQVYNLLDRWALRAPTEIATVSRASQQQLAKRGIHRPDIVVFHNAVDSSKFCRKLSATERNRTKRDLGISVGDQVVLCVGRFSIEKAQTDLVTAFAHLQELKPSLPVQLILLGEGAERTRIEHAVRSRNLCDHVSLPGYCGNVQRYYEVADVVAIPSISEASPNVLLEAMAAGVPVVATAVGGIPEIATDEETALLVDPRLPEAMAAAIHRVLTTPELSQRLANSARELVVRRFSPEGRARILVDLYSRIHARYCGNQTRT